jgi:hypothetical protein
MSLINDALKRARDLHQKNPPPAPPLVPVEPKMRRRRRDGNWFLPALIFLLIITAFFFFTLAMEKRTVSKIVNAPEISATQQVESASETPNPPLVPLPAEIGPAAITSAVAAPPESPHVQGIFYDPVHPSAIIDGKTVSPGSVMNGMRVIKILRDSVTLIGNGKTNTLIVGE